MALARDTIIVTFDGRRYALRPTLQAATRLEHEHGLGKVLKGVLDGRVSMMAAVMREVADLDLSLAATLDRFCEPTVAVNMIALQPPLKSLVYGMLGIDPEAEVKPVTGKTVPIAEHLAQLYRIATGWLGWTPSVALASTPAEISEAYRGRVDMLEAIFGKGEKAPEVDLDTKFRAIFGGMKHRQAKAA